MGPYHTSTIATTFELASSYIEAGMAQEVEKLGLEEMLEHQKERLSETHPSTVLSMIKLAGLYVTLTRPLEALAIFEKCYAIRKASLGENHELSIGTRVNIASCLGNAHRYEEACAVHAEMIERISTHLGADHPMILATLINSSADYRAIGQKDTALENIQRAVDISTKLLGPKHPMTLTAINALGATYQVCGDFGKAEAVMEAAIALCDTGEEESAPTYLSLLSNLGNCKRMLTKYQESLPLGQKAIELRVKYLGMDHLETLRGQMTHAALLAETHDAAGAFPLINHVVTTVKSKYPGEKHFLYESYTIMANTVMKFEGRLSEGFQYMVLAVEGFEELLGKEHETTKQVCGHLSSLYGQVGDPAQAKYWAERGGQEYVRKRNTMGLVGPVVGVNETRYNNILCSTLLLR